MMLNNRLLCRTARNSSRDGFTLVELLVVIGIIAILAGVALGPITSGIKKGQQSSGVQTARTLALAEFQYSNDNSQTYPFGTDASKVANLLVAGGYVSDPGIFVISGSAESKYTGSPTTPNYATTNVSWDFGQTTTTQGLTANAPDQAPLVVSSGAGAALTAALPTAGAASTITVGSGAPFGTAGMAICFKSNSAKFIIAPKATPGVTPILDASWPGYTMVMAVGGG
jgi:prepilin-type N-terminal cleavage/methylation domain-containing protein